MSSGMIKAKLEQKHNPHVVLSVDGGEFDGCEFYFDAMKFADEPNDDGTINMSFNYEIVNDFKVDPDRDDVFCRMLGDFLYATLTEQVKKGDAIYKTSGE